MTTRTFLLTAVISLSWAAACSDGESGGNTPPPAPDAGPVCDTSKCHPGNVCVQDKCRLQCERHTDCPDAFDCVAVDGQQVCMENGMKYGLRHYGQSCGVSLDDDCEAADGFICIGALDDPTAYCSRSPCETDKDCPGDYYCGHYDRADGTNVRACLKRSFCAPAEGIIDCHDEDAVFATDQGQGVCVRSCDPADPKACGGGNACYQTENGPQCWPRTKTCVPSKTFCGRCTSSADCPSGGRCYTARYTKESFCVTPCSTAANCSKPPGTAPGMSVGCGALGGETTKRCWPGIFDAQGSLTDITCWGPCPTGGCQ